MIDASFKKSFFSRDKDKKIIGSDISGHWHNENQGVMMINDFDKKIKFVSLLIYKYF